MVKKIILAKPRGFCAGVDRAIKSVEDSLAFFPKPIYVKHAIVHNTHIMRELEQKGAITVESVDDIPTGSVVVFSAHGSPPEDYSKARSKGLHIIDATCPLVTKVHREVIRYTAEGYEIVYIGQKDHVEPQGVMGETSGNIHLVSNKTDVESLNISHPKLIYLTQTTLSKDDTLSIVEALQTKFPQIRGPAKEDICYATTNRQAAVRALCPLVNLIIVVGSSHSSNSKKLVEVAKHHHVSAFLIEDVTMLQSEWDSVDVIGITSGASVPEYLVSEVVEHFKNTGALVESLQVVQEDTLFLEPHELLKLKQGTPHQRSQSS